LALLGVLSGGAFLWVVVGWWMTVGAGRFLVVGYCGSVGVVGCCIKGEAFGRGIFGLTDKFFAECFAPTMVWGLILWGMVGK
jgi:hypothetical protein